MDSTFNSSTYPQLDQNNFIIKLAKNPWEKFSCSFNNRFERILIQIVKTRPLNWFNIMLRLMSLFQ